MTDYQNELVMEHLDLVNWVIRTRISVPNRPLLTYDDFYAIGCEAICRAALKYQADSGEFAPFACRYIYNAIIDHCRAMNYRLQRSVDAGFEEGEVFFDLLAHTTVDFEAEVTDDSAMAALRACKEKYQGVARKGVEAIELKLQGYESVEIADLYGTTVNNVNASIPQWDDLMIANIVENAINAIDERIGYYCHPFYHEVDKLPCYLGDRCDNPHCIFKSDPDYRKAPSSVMDMDIEERG